MPERLFYCGRASSPRHLDRAIELSLAGRGRNINRRFEDIETRMVADVPDHLRDLLDIATYVFVADRMVTRGGDTLPNMGSEWRRRLRLHIAVRKPHHWEDPSVKARLRDLVGLISEDSYHFDFSQLDEEPQFPSRLALSTSEQTPSRYDQVILFSGGLDSLAGAALELDTTDDRIVLISHRSSDRAFSHQRKLAVELAERHPGRVLHVPVEITMTQSLHDAEFTQRTRSFLFFALGCVVAEMLGRDRVRFFENGVVSFNLPIAPQVVGTRATRSTHPLVLSRMTSFAQDMLGHPFEVGNPFLWHTKAEVVRLIAEHGDAGWIRHSISCTHLRKTEGADHCGDCTQCLQRRFGVLATGLSDHDPADGYAIELLAQERGERSMALSVVSSALDFPRWSIAGFLHRYAGELLRAAAAVRPGDTESFVQRAYDLHCRYGKEVGQVIDNAIRNYAPDIREKVLPPGCLLRAVIADDQFAVNRAPLAEPFPRADFEPDGRDLRHTTRIHLAFDEDGKRLMVEGLGHVGTTRQYELLLVLAAQHRQDREAELLPENFAFVLPTRLMDELQIDDEAAVRQLIGKFRRRAADLAQARWGLMLNRNAIVENRSRAGYRLNPEVLLVDISELGEPSVTN